MRTKARVWLALVLLAAAAPMLSACYTTRGAGEDLKAAGNGIEHSADQHTNYKP
ncbi:MAG TPA: entericidin A/B family lipoprotein [Rhodopila sp.]|jgi:predicted small secreted protein|nr:entericidin A/B family lipoprotein [Rhodopila sp.]